MGEEWELGPQGWVTSVPLFGTFLHPPLRKGRIERKEPSVDLPLFSEALLVVSTSQSPGN